MNARSLFAALFFALVAVGSTQAQSFDNAAVSEATAAYETGRYDEALRSANRTAKDKNASLTQRVEAFRLQGLAYSALGQDKKARKAVDQMVFINPGYEARTSDSAAFTALVQDAQQRYANGELTPKAKGPSQRFYNVVAAGMSVLTIYLGISAAVAM